LSDGHSISPIVTLLGLVACEVVVPWLGGGMGRPAAMAIMLFMFMPPATERCKPRV